MDPFLSDLPLKENVTGANQLHPRMSFLFLLLNGTWALFVVPAAAVLTASKTLYGGLTDHLSNPSCLDYVCVITGLKLCVIVFEAFLCDRTPDTSPTTFMPERDARCSMLSRD